MIAKQPPGPMTAQTNEFYERLHQAMNEVPEIDPRDLGKHSQWGIDASGKPVIVDYGFTRGMKTGVMK